ncbi:MAG: tol-pal system protein YbgF [Desulfovibrio sp.]|nr:tol-pal system protein YbgF [Desulfovibrio sp.]
MKAKHILPLACAAMLALPGCAPKNDQLEAQLMQHDAQLRRMQPAQADALNEVQAMRQELNEIKGQLVDIRNAGGAAAMVDKLNRHEQALHQIESSMAMNFNLGAPIAAGAAGGAGAGAAVGAASAGTAVPAPTPAAVPAAYGQAQPQPVSLTQASARVAQGAVPGQPVQAAVPQQSNQVPTGETWGRETPKPEAPKAQKDMTIALYDAGVNSFNARNYSEAQRSFSDYMKNFSSSPKAPAAQYYLAECYFQKNQFSDAALAYDTVITKYGSSAKAPAAYLKQGICFSKMGQGKAAQARMQELIRKFPSSPEAARAKSFLKTNS